MTDCEKNAIANAVAQATPGVGLGLMATDKNFTPFGNGPTLSSNPATELDQISGWSGFAALGSNIPTEVSKDHMEDKAECKTVKTTEEQDKQLAERIRVNQLIPGSYNLYTRNCSAFVRDALRDILKMNIRGNSPLPRSVYDQIP